MRPQHVSRRSFLLTTGALLATAPIITACGGSGSGDAKELSFWNFYGPNDSSPNPQERRLSEWFTKTVDTWNANNEVKVKLRYLPAADYFAGTTLQTAFSSGEGPDIFLVSPGDFLRYYNGGVLTDLTPHLTKDARADYVDGVLDTRTVDGKVYGLPLEIEPLAMYYGIDAFQNAGLSEGDLPKTWDQLLSVADKLTGSDRFGVLFETIPGYYQNFTWYPFMWMGNGNAVDGNRSAFDSPASVKALQLWQDTIKQGLAPKKPQGDGASDIVNLATGFVGMQQTGIWSVSDLAGDYKDFKYGVFPLPTPSGGTQTTDMGGWAFVANAKGGNPEAAAKFITWALGSTDDDGVERHRQWNTVIKTNLPPRTSVNEAAKANGAFASGPLAAFADTIAPVGRSEPRYPPEVYQAVSDAIQGCQLGGKEPASATADAAEKIDGFLKSYDGAPII